MTHTIEHLSYSQYNSYTRCPRSWYLSKVRGGEERQSWYTPIGTAVHSMIEDYLAQRSLGSDSNADPSPATASAFRAEAYFYPLIERQMEVEPDLTKWLAGGPEAAPITHEKALQKVTDCFEKAVEELEVVDVWEVEYDASGRLPGLEVPLKAFIDIIGEHKTKGPVIWDWKTGSTKPDNFQLETYAALLGRDGPRFTHPLVEEKGWRGRYIMLSPTYTSTTRYVDLSKVDPAEVGAKYQKVYERMKAKRYETKAGFGCKFCFQKDNCLVNVGPTERAMYFDHSATDGLPY